MIMPMTAAKEGNIVQVKAIAKKDGLTKMDWNSA